MITGGSTDYGLGMAVAILLYLKGAHVILLCRSKKKAESLLSYMIELGMGAPCRGVADFVHLDLASLDSVRACVRELNAKTHKIDILLNNAGEFSLYYLPAATTNNRTLFLFSNIYQ